MRKIKYYRDSGRNGPTILLLHGFPASHTYWRSTQKFLTKKGSRVISIDLLGFGNAPKPEDVDYTYKDHVEYVHRLLEELGINQPLSIIGHSMGGLIGARFANIYPDKVDKLILLHPPLYDSPVQAHDTIYKTNGFYRFILASHFRNIAWVLLRPLSLFIIAKHTSKSREQSFKNVVLGGEIFEDFDNLRRKTLLVVGSNDRPQYLLNLKRHQLNEFVTLRMENVGHHSVIFEKKLIRTIILTFLNN